MSGNCDSGGAKSWSDSAGGRGGTADAESCCIDPANDDPGTELWRDGPDGNSDAESWGDDPDGDSGAESWFNTDSLSYHQQFTRKWSVHSQPSSKDADGDTDGGHSEPDPVEPPNDSVAEK